MKFVEEKRAEKLTTITDQCISKLEELDSPVDRQIVIEHLVAMHCAKVGPAHSSEVLAGINKHVKQLLQSVVS